MHQNIYDTGGIAGIISTNILMRQSSEKQVLTIYIICYMYEHSLNKACYFQVP